MEYTSNKKASRKDHDYNLAVLKEACDEEDIQELEDMEVNKVTALNDHTPLPSPDPKRLKNKNVRTRETEANVSNDSIYEAIQKVLQRFDKQDMRLKSFETQIEANTKAVKENREEIEKMKKEITSLKKENSSLK